MRSGDGPDLALSDVLLGRERDFAAPSLWSRTSTWMFMVILLFLAGHGTLPFQHGGGNSAIAARYGSLVDAPDSVQTMEARSLTIAVLLVCCCILLFRARAVWSGLGRSWPLLGLTFVPLLSLAWSANPQKTLTASILVAVNIAFGVFLAQRFSPREQRELTMIFGWVAIIMSIILALWFPAVGIDHREGVEAWQGIAVQKNSCAIVMIYLLSPVFFMRRRGGLYGVRNLLYALGCLLVIIMTQSRTGWLSLLVLAGLGVSWRVIDRFVPRERATIAAAFAASAITIAFVAYLYLPAVLMALGKDPTMTGRTTLWALVVGTAMKHPLLGLGYNAFWNPGEAGAENIALAMGGTPSHAQNGFLDVWLELGAIGLGLVLWMIVRAFRDAIACMKSQDCESVGWYLAIVVITVVTNLDERSIMYPNFLEWVLCVMACVGLMNEAGRLRSIKAMGELAA